MHALLSLPAAWAAIEFYRPVPGKGIEYNPYIIDHNLAPPASISPVCSTQSENHTDQPICWDPLIGFTCEKCCFRDDKEIKKSGTCWAYVKAPLDVPSELIEDYCCKGRLKPDFDNLKQKTLALSDGDSVRPPMCARPGSDADTRCFAPTQGFPCESCCFNPETHPVSFASDKRQKVEDSPCWLIEDESHPMARYVGLETAKGMSSYDLWLKCCLRSCPPDMSESMCAIMPMVPYLAIAFFVFVTFLCYIFEFTLVNNKLCFANPPEDRDPFANAIEEQQAEEAGVPLQKKRGSMFGRASGRSSGRVAPDGGGGVGLE